MPRIKHQIQEEHLIKLQSLVSYVFGKKILNSTDCIELSQGIFDKVKSSVSSDTLRRFFGLIETKTQPSLFTMEILSKYVGFAGYYDFVDSVVLVGKYRLNKQILDCVSDEKLPFQALEALQKAQPSSDYYSTLQQLILLAFQKKDKLFFELLFEDQPGFEWITIFKYEIYQTIQLLGKLVERNDWLQEIALKNYVGLPFFFDYFVEWYVAEDKPYYSKLLDEFSRVNRNNSDKLLFYHCILSLKFYRKKEFNFFELHANAVLELDSNSKTNNILKSRILGVQFLKKWEIDEVEAFKLLKEINFQTMFPDIGDRITSLFFLFNYLYEAKAYLLMISLFERWVSHDAVYFSIWTRINWNQLCLFMAYAYFNENNMSQAKNYFNLVDPALFEVYNSDRFERLYTEFEKGIA
jgi:hypothetical protein